jgi:hypothetical protein
MIDINEGHTNNYLVHGVFTLILSAPLMYFHVLFWLPFILIAIALFTSSNGLLIDVDNMRYKAYGNLLGYKTGKWITISRPIHAALILSIERAKTNQAYIMGERGFSKSMTYDIQLTNEFGETILMYEFLKYRIAIKALAAIEKGFKIKVTDKVAEKLIQNQVNPRR